MKKIVCTAMILTILVALCACSNEIVEGEVYEKEYRAEQTRVMMIPLIISNGKTFSTIMVPYFIHYPDRYVVFIKSYHDGEWKTEDFYVSKEVYDVVNVGDMFLFDEERGDLQDEPYTKKRKEE